jgi:hypothetical protein
MSIFLARATLIPPAIWKNVTAFSASWARAFALAKPQRPNEIAESRQSDSNRRPADYKSLG